MPFWAKFVFRGDIWRKPQKEPTLYLTFDDGPIPKLTEWVLSELEKYSVLATFFCVGDNIRKYPQIFKKLLEQDHFIGNHTFNHLKGWETDLSTYLENVQLCQDALQNQSNLFRPPYGKMTTKQYQSVRKQYQIVMWDVLTYDFDISLSPEKCLQKSIQMTRNGSIVVFHDNLKAEKNLKYVLPRYIEHFLNQGYQFAKLG